MEEPNQMQTKRPCSLNKPAGTTGISTESYLMSTNVEFGTASTPKSLILGRFTMNQLVVSCVAFIIVVGGTITIFAVFPNRDTEGTTITNSGDIQIPPPAYT